MQYFAIGELSDRIKYEENPSLVHEEARYVWGLHKSGFLRSVHHRLDVRGVVLLLEADSLDYVEKMLAGLPLAREGYLSITGIMPVAPYTSYERIFRAEDED